VRLLSEIDPRVDEHRVYADASALVKLIVREPESSALLGYLGDPRPQLTTSRLAVVEVVRAVKVARPERDAVERAWRLLETCTLLEVTASILRQAAALSSDQLGALDAVHLASIVLLGPHDVLAYDRRLAGEARSRGYRVAHPGADL
jgi:predicted nucleic acid-binding protein